MRLQPLAVLVRCTWALLPLVSLPEIEVIIGDTNWIASVAPIVYLGAKPVFVDVLAGTWCVNPSKIETDQASRTKAIIAVSSIASNNICDMEELLAIGEKHGIPVVEDAAEAIGSKWHDKRAGSMVPLGLFLFMALRH